MDDLKTKKSTTIQKQKGLLLEEIKLDKLLDKLAI